MGKKYIVINGKKKFLDELEIKDADQDAGAGETTGTEGETPQTPAGEPSEQNLDAEAKRVAKTLAKEIGAVLGIEDMKAKMSEMDGFMAQSENSKLRELLHGKDLIKDKDSLTKEEKIVGFFHGLVNKDDTVLKALSEGVSADGGYLFPAEFLAELVRPLAVFPRMRSLVRVITMKRNTLNAASLVNRPKIYWTAENAAKTTTTANFGQPTLTARKAAAILYASDELIEDSTEFDVVQTIINLFSEAIGEEEDRVILRGNGTTEPTGISTAVTASTIASVTCSGNLDFDDIIELEYALKQKYRPGSTFLIHPTNMKELRKIKDNEGRYIFEPSRVTGTPATIMSYPVLESYDMPESAIYFGNWKLAYWLGDRKAMTVKISNDTTQAFTQDQTAIRVVIRLGGNVVLGEAAKALVTIP